MPVFEAEENAVTRLAQEQGRLAVVELAFEAAREGNPRPGWCSTTLTWSPDYERLIEECLAAGIQIDAIGLQTHMHQGFRGRGADSRHPGSLRAVRAAAAADRDDPACPAT